MSRLYAYCICMCIWVVQVIVKLWADNPCKTIQNHAKPISHSVALQYQQYRDPLGAQKELWICYYAANKEKHDFTSFDHFADFKLLVKIRWPVVARSLSNLSRGGHLENVIGTTLGQWVLIGCVFIGLQCLGTACWMLSGGNEECLGGWNCSEERWTWPSSWWKDAQKDRNCEEPWRKKTELVAHQNIRNGLHSLISHLNSTKSDMIPIKINSFFQKFSPNNLWIEIPIQILKKSFPRSAEV